MKNHHFRPESMKKELSKYILRQSKVDPETGNIMIQIRCDGCNKNFLELASVAGRKVLDDEKILCIRCDPGSEESSRVIFILV